MTDWKRVFIYGSLGAAAFLLITGRRPAGGVLAGIGLAALASEYPEQIERLWRDAPEYLDKGTRVINTVAAFVERLAEQRTLRGTSTYAM
jgi:hypothetical protein